MTLLEGMFVDETLKCKLRKIKLFVYDFDGVMTDNTVSIDENGMERVIVNRSDGYAVSHMKQSYMQIILSTEVNPMVLRRAEKLQIPAINGVGDKCAALRDYCFSMGISLDHVMFIGNDLNDYEAMTLCALKGCPSDAEPEITAIADWVSGRKGGGGVIRELMRLISEINMPADEEKDNI